MFEIALTLLTRKIPKDLSIKIDEKRRELITNTTLLSVLDYGAGSNKNKIEKTKSISTIYKSSASGKQKGRFLCNLIEIFKPHKVLEMGTSLGIGTMHLYGTSVIKVYTLEGSASIAYIAKDTIKYWGSKSEIIVGSFEVTFMEILNKDNEIDFFYIDGNHTYDATIRYFEWIKKYSNQRKLIIVFDDIYWSKGMTLAWEKIKKDNVVNFSIDLFQIGVIQMNMVDFNPKHYKLILSILKPWEMGFSPVRG